MTATFASPKDRKQRPIATGVIDYFPDALMEVAHCSFVGNEQHNPGTALHWDRAKSGDERDALLRHFLARGSVDSDGVRHSAKVAWRALALLQKEIEADRDKGRDDMDGTWSERVCTEKRRSQDQIDAYVARGKPLKREKP